MYHKSTINLVKISVNYLQCVNYKINISLLEFLPISDVLKPKFNLY